MTTSIPKPPPCPLKQYTSYLGYHRYEVVPGLKPVHGTTAANGKKLFEAIGPDVWESINKHKFCDRCMKKTSMTIKTSLEVEKGVFQSVDQCSGCHHHYSCTNTRVAPSTDALKRDNPEMSDLETKLAFLAQHCPDLFLPDYVCTCCNKKLKSKPAPFSFSCSILDRNGLFAYFCPDCAQKTAAAKGRFPYLVDSNSMLYTEKDPSTLSNQFVIVNRVYSPALLVPKGNWEYEGLDDARCTK